MKKDYYKILGVEKNSSEDDIKKAYRKLAHQHHPDKAGGDEQKFKEINEAYQVLGNGEKRKLYDQFGTAEPHGFHGGNPFGGGSPFQGFDVGDIGDLGEMFEEFFGGFGAARDNRKRYARGANIQIVQEITLEEALRGIKKEIVYHTLLRCTDCGGAGHDARAGFVTCSVCGGKGEIQESHRTFFGTFSRVKTCSECQGAGKVSNAPCKACKGSGRAKGERRVTVEILPGVSDGQIINLKHMGEAGERGAEEGDLYVLIRVRPHSLFKRVGNDLHLKQEVSLVNLLLGHGVEAQTIDGKKINVEVPPGFNVKEPLRVKGEGMPHFGSWGRGDLVIDLAIRLPKKISAKAKKILEELEGEL